MVIQSHDRCPRCGEGRMRNWIELDEEERMIVRRLPLYSQVSADARESMIRWCTRCWYEETQGARFDA